MKQSFARRADALARDSYYEASVVRAADDAPLDRTLDVDVCVIGAGFAGLSTALDCRARGLSVAVIDAHRPGWGASGRNGGQAIAGFAKDDEIERQLGADGARAAWSLSFDGLALIAERIARYGIDCDFTRGYLTVATKPRGVDALRAWMDAATSRWGHPSLAWLDADAIGTRIASTRYLAGVHDPLSGHLHPLKYCLGLADAARREGVALHAHTPALDVVRGARPVVRTPGGEVRCRFVVSCCNAGPGGILPAATAARIAPIASYIIATEPLAQDRADALVARREAVCDNNFFLDYFRLSADNRMLFGGRANSAGASPDTLADTIRQRMVRVFPQLADV
ncbi:FAD-dependent oxidoreductase, partial [Burkholderia multivorans]